MSAISWPRQGLKGCRVYIRRISTSLNIPRNAVHAHAEFRLLWCINFKGIIVFKTNKKRLINLGAAGKYGRMINIGIIGLALPLFFRQVIKLNIYRIFNPVPGEKVTQPYHSYFFALRPARLNFLIYSLISAGETIVGAGHSLEEKAKSLKLFVPLPTYVSVIISAPRQSMLIHRVVVGRVLHACGFQTGYKAVQAVANKPPHPIDATEPFDKGGTDCVVAADEGASWRCPL